MLIKSMAAIVFLAFGFPCFAAPDICGDAEREFSAASKVYVEKGGVAFWNRLLKDGPLEEDKRSQGQVQVLGQIEQYFGSMQSSFVVSKRQLGGRACYLYAVLEYDNGPAFAVVTYYRGKKGVAATSMEFKTEAENVFPPHLLVE